MTVNKPRRICVVPRVSGVGGMVSFRHKLLAGLAAQGFETCDALEDTPYQAVLVIGGTRQVGKLWQVRRRGVRIVQRLDGMNWLHRLGLRQPAQRTGARHFLRAEYGNTVLALIRNRLVHHIVYQSEFVHGWWDRVSGRTSVPSTVIYNGVDLAVYTPQGLQNRPEENFRLLLV